MQHRFVEFIPDEIEAGVLYVSMQYATAVHLCCCGCGNEVVTPLTPVDWQMTFDGKTITLSPSIGNWGFKCQSHYLIIKNEVKWAEAWSKEWIAKNRSREALKRDRYYQPETEDNFWNIFKKKKTEKKK